MRAIVKGVLHVIVKAVILTSRAIKRHPLPALILATMLIGAFFAVSSGLVALSWLGINTATARSGPLAAIETYLDGQRQGDATRMWQSLSDELRANEQSLPAAERQVEMAKLRDLHYNSFQYVGGSAIDDGNSVHLYIVSVSSGAQTRQIPYTFTLNKAGKIVAID